jgi:hypothetical protein
MRVPSETSIRISELHNPEDLPHLRDNVIAADQLATPETKRVSFQATAPVSWLSGSLNPAKRNSRRSPELISASDLRPARNGCKFDWNCRTGKLADSPSTFGTDPRYGLNHVCHQGSRIAPP